MAILSEGSKAPTISAKDQLGNLISLEAFKGKKVLLYFYPSDNTPGCTAEACNLRDNFEELTNKGFEVIGVSPDSEKSHIKFIEKYKLPFTLISDPDHAVAKAFGVYDMKKFMGREFMGILRTSFIIDEKGIIEKVISKVATKDHAAQILI